MAELQNTKKVNDMNAGMQGHGTEGSHTGVYGNTGTEAGGLFDLILLLLTPDCGTEAEIK